jgi:hypothetical protein
METTVWVAIIVAISTLIASLGATWLNNLSSNKRFKIELGRAIDFDKRARRWQVRSEPLLQLKRELAEMDLWGRRLVETCDEKFGNLNIECITKLGTLIQNGNIERTLSAIGDKELEETTTKSIHSYTQAFFYVKDLPNTLSIVELKEATKRYYRNSSSN